MDHAYLYKIYTETADRFEKGHWTSGSWGGATGSNCLVGGLNRTIYENQHHPFLYKLPFFSAFATSTGLDTRAELPEIIIDELVEEIDGFDATYHGLLPIHTKQQILIRYNDTRGRMAVIAALRRCAKRHDVENEIERLRARVVELKSRISALECENHRLRLQNQVLKADREELLKLDAELKEYEKQLLQLQH